MKRSLIAILIASIILNGCVGDNASTSKIGNNSNNAKLASTKTAFIKASGEHPIEKPDYDKRKEEYDKIKDKIVVDHDTDKPAPDKFNNGNPIHELLARLPTELTQNFNNNDGKIRLINSSDNWQTTLIERGINSKTTIINKFGEETHLSDAIVYFDPNATTPTIYVNNNVNYNANADSRKELDYGLIRGLVKSQNISFDNDFVRAVSSFGTVEGIEYYRYPELEDISKLADKDISTEENQEKMATLFASIMSDSLEYGDDYNNAWPQMANYLKEFEKKFDTIDHDSDDPCPKAGGECKYTGSNILDNNLLSDKEKVVIQSVHKLIANNIYDSPTAMYENLIFRDGIDENLVKALNTEIENIIDQKLENAQSTTSIDLEINDSELTKILNKIFLNQGSLTSVQTNNIINFIRKNYKFNSISAKYVYIFNETKSNYFGSKYVSLLDEKIMVCDNFAILNYFILKQKNEFKDDLMIPVQIASGHTVLAVKHKNQKGEDTIYIADSWIPFLNSDEKIKPFFGDLDSYFSYIDDKFGNSEDSKKSTWHNLEDSAKLKPIIREAINDASNHKNLASDLFGNKGIDLDNQQQMDLINNYISELNK